VLKAGLALRLKDQLNTSTTDLGDAEDLLKEMTKDDASHATVSRGDSPAVKVQRPRKNVKVSSRVTRLQLDPDSETGNTEMGVAENKGLMKLDLNGHPINKENWTILCQSLKGHPTLTSLGHSCTSPRALDGARIEISREQRAQRTSVVVEMMKKNTILHTIRLSEHERDDQIYMEMIHSYLDTNIYRPRVLCTQSVSRKWIFRSVDPCSGGHSCRPSRSGTSPISSGCSCRGIRMLWFDRSNEEDSGRVVEGAATHKSRCVRLLI
jgi:hypothetical protein